MTTSTTTKNKPSTPAKGAPEPKKPSKARDPMRSAIDGLLQKDKMPDEAVVKK